jgi:hypothetical protein
LKILPPQIRLVQTSSSSSSSPAPVASSKIQTLQQIFSWHQITQQPTSFLELLLVTQLHPIAAKFLTTNSTTAFFFLLLLPQVLQ